MYMKDIVLVTLETDELLLKEEHPIWQDNRRIAQRITENIIERLDLSREPPLLQKYGYIVNEQVKRWLTKRVD